MRWYWYSSLSIRLTHYFSVTTLEQEKKELMVTAQGLTKMTQSLKKEITEYKERLAELEQSASMYMKISIDQYFIIEK